MTFNGTKLNLHLTMLPGELKTVHFILYKHGIYIQLLDKIINKQLYHVEVAITYKDGTIFHIQFA